MPIYCLGEKPIKRYANLASFPVTGELEYFYLAEDTDLIYVWGGTSYVNVGGNLSNYQLLSEKGAANGYAPLTAASKIDSVYLPAYVDDVLEYSDLASFPVSGSTGVLYVDLATNLTYRWSGSVYVELTDTTATWGSINGTLSNQTDLNNALNGKIGTGLSSGNILVGNASNIATPRTMSGDATISNVGALTIANSAVTNVKVASGIDAAKIGDGSVSNTEFQRLDGVVDNVQTQLNRRSATGITWGGEITLASGTTFNIAAGEGHITDYSVNPPTRTFVSWGAQSNVAATLIATGQFTRIEVNSAGTVSQTNAVQTDSDRLNKIQLGVLVHDNLTTITNAYSAPNPDYNQSGSLRDLAESIGTIIKSGGTYSANGANLNLNRSAGTAFVWGRAYGGNKNFPSNITINAGTALQFYRVHQSGANTFTYSALQTAIDPSQYNSGNALISVPSNKWQIQYIYFYPEHGNTYIVYGQNIYNSQSEAVAAIGRESTVHDVRFARASLRAFLVVKQGATALNDTAQAAFYSGGKFGSVSPTGSAISSVTDLQSAYNASVHPEIVLDNTKTNPALTVRNSTTPVTGNLFEVQNNAGSTTHFSVDATGVKANTTASRALQSDASGYITPSATTSTELGYVSGVTSAIQTQLNNKTDGAASSTDNAIARFDGTTGKIIQNSTAIIDDSGNVGLGSPTIAARLHIKGAGATSATKSLKIDNSANTEYLSVRDDGLVTVNQFVSAKTANYTVLNTEGDTLFTNTGATGQVDFTLPTAVAGLEYRFYTNAAQIIRVIAGAGDVIRRGSQVTAAAGNVATTASLGNYFELVAIDATTWVMISSTENGAFTFT